MRTKTVTTLKVESQMGNVIDSELDISFLEMDCAMVALHFENTRTQNPINVKSEKIAIESGKGCRLLSSFSLFPGEGNFHVALSNQQYGFGGHNHLYGKEELAQFNCSHKVNSLWFGSKERGDVNTLDGYEKNMNASFNHVTYFLKLIPVEEVPLHGSSRLRYEYSVTEYRQLVEGPGLFGRTSPGVYFKYQITPIRMRKEEYRTGLLQFYTTLCSIVGGVMSGIVQSLLTHTVMPSKLD
ncbi:hypothetical protein BLSTO_04381 [Blastocystis sp. subtype 1]